MNAELRAAFWRRFSSQVEIDVAFQHPLDSFATTALVGASGSGKTTVLRALAGLERPDAGEIVFDGEPWFAAARRIDRPTQKRGVGFLHQDFALFPHLDVAQNIAFGLTRLSAAARNARVSELLSLLKLDGLQRRRPRELSGGQQQRVALARAVAGRPRLLLLDEPLSALDTPTRRELRGELRRLLQTLAIPTLLVTHDPADVQALADRVVVLDHGRVLQAGAAAEVFARPADQQVARLLARD